MKKAGGVVAILAGISGVIVTGDEIVGLLRDEDFMGLSYATEVLLRGYIALAIYVATVALGAVALRTKGRLAGILLIFCAIAAALLFGATGVIVFAAQAAVGALMVLFGKEPQPEGQTPTMAG